MSQNYEIIMIITNFKTNTFEVPSFFTTFANSKIFYILSQ